jgi:nucleotide-binding universal stress UspA family protein
MTDQAPANDEFALDELPRLASLLVPLDGSRLAEAVLPAVTTLGVQLGATTTLLHVLERGAPATVHGQPHLQGQEAAETYLDGIAARLVSAGLSVQTHVHPNPMGDIAHSIVEHARELGSDLVVLASHGAGGLRGLLFGRIAQQVVRRGTFPVFLVPVSVGPAGKTDWTPRTAMVALNGTAEAEAALPVTAAVARALGLTLVLVYAVPTLGSVPRDQTPVAAFVPGATRAVLDLEADEAERYLERVVREVVRLAIAASGVVLRGEPAAAIAAEAERRGVDLLAIATHGRGGLEGAWSGSVGAKILGRFGRPLLLVPAPG